MKAKINAPLGYRCAPDGKTVQFFAEGTIVDGVVAEYALADMAAVKVHDPRTETKVEAPTEAKGRGRPRKHSK